MAAAQRLTSATAEAAAFSQGSGPVAAEAQLLLADLELDDLADPTEMDLSELFDISEETLHLMSEIVLRDSVRPWPMSTLSPASETNMS